MCSGLEEHPPAFRSEMWRMCLLFLPHISETGYLPGVDQGGATKTTLRVRKMEPSGLLGILYKLQGVYKFGSDETRIVEK